MGGGLRKKRRIVTPKFLPSLPSLSLGSLLFYIRRLRSVSLASVHVNLGYSSSVPSLLFKSATRRMNFGGSDAIARNLGCFSELSSGR